MMVRTSGIRKTVSFTTLKSYIFAVSLVVTVFGKLRLSPVS